MGPTMTGLVVPSRSWFLGPPEMNLHGHSALKGDPRAREFERILFSKALGNPTSPRLGLFLKATVSLMSCGGL